MIKEIWKDIQDYEGLYQVSNLGKIKRILFINNKVAKKVKCIEINKIYNSIIEASRELNIYSSNIVNCCKHKKYNKTAGGYHFEYV